MRKKVRFIPFVLSLRDLPFDPGLWQSLSRKKISSFIKIHISYLFLRVVLKHSKLNIGLKA